MFILAEYKTNPKLDGSYSNEDIESILATEQPTTLSLARLTHNLVLKDWEDAAGRMFSAKMFLSQPNLSRYQAHKCIIHQAKPFDYPLTVWLDKDTDQYFLVDGMHRLVHLIMLQTVTQAPVKVLTDQHLALLQSPLIQLALAARKMDYPRPKPIQGKVFLIFEQNKNTLGRPCLNTLDKVPQTMPIIAHRKTPRKTQTSLNSTAASHD